MNDPGETRTPAPEATEATEPPRYEPAPPMGKLLLWALVVLIAAVVVVGGGVYFAGS